MPDNSNVIPMPDANEALGRRYAAACERTTHGRQEWIEGSLEKAAILIEARDRNSDQAFGAWLRENASDLDPHERADLMNLGRNPARAREVFEGTTLETYRNIWERYQIRYGADPIPNSEPAADTSSNVRSTGRGPWNNIIDATLTELFHEHGNHPTVLAPLLTRAHAEAVADRDDRMFTPGMCQTAMRRLGLVQQSPSRTQQAPTPAAPAPAPARQHLTLVPLTREQIDPTWTDADGDWTHRHGHVNQLTAARRATAMLTTVSAEMAAAAQAIREQPEQQPGRDRNLFDAYWLRHLTNPRQRDVAKLREAMEYLRPLITEAEAALARAISVQSETAASS